MNYNYHMTQQILCSCGGIRLQRQGLRSESLDHTHTHTLSRSVFPNRRAAARYRALASIIPGREMFYWN